VDTNEAAVEAGFRFYGLGCRVEGVRFRDTNEAAAEAGFRFYGLGCRV